MKLPTNARFPRKLLVHTMVLFLVVLLIGSCDRAEGGKFKQEEPPQSHFYYSHNTFYASTNSLKQTETKSLDGDTAYFISTILFNFDLEMSNVSDLKEVETQLRARIPGTAVSDYSSAKIFQFVSSIRGYELSPVTGTRTDTMGLCFDLPQIEKLDMGFDESFFNNYIITFKAYCSSPVSADRTYAISGGICVLVETVDPLTPKEPIFQGVDISYCDKNYNDMSINGTPYVGAASMCTEKKIISLGCD